MRKTTMKHVAGLTFIGWLTGMQLLAAADPGSNSRLFKAIRDGDVEAIRRSIETEADLNARDDRGNSPLHLAALNLDADTVALLGRDERLRSVPVFGIRER